MLLLIVCSCTTTKLVPVETVRTELISSITYDSIYIKDSVDRYIQGDTVYLYKAHTLYKYKSIIDTLIVTDTITNLVEVEAVKEIKVNELHWWQKSLMWLGGIFSLLVIMIIIRKFK